MELPFGNNLRYLRNLKGWTIESLGEYLGLANSSVSTWENYRGYPKFTVLVKLVELYDVNLHDLVYTDLTKEPIEVPATETVKIEEPAPPTYPPTSAEDLSVVELVKKVLSLEAKVEVIENQLNKK